MSLISGTMSHLKRLKWIVPTMAVGKSLFSMATILPRKNKRHLKKSSKMTKSSIGELISLKKKVSKLKGVTGRSMAVLSWKKQRYENCP